MKCQRGKRCIKQPENALPILKGDKLCTGCDKMGKDKARPVFDACVEHIRNLDKKGFRKLRREADVMFGKETTISVGEGPKSTMIPLSAVLKAIDDEEEYPARPMPDSVWEKICGDRMKTEKALRITVALTKKNISERIMEFASKKEK